MFKNKGNNIEFDKKKMQIATSILEEEEKELNEEELIDSILFKYGSVDSNLAGVIRDLYSGECDLRSAVISVAANYEDHEKPGIFGLVSIIEFLAQHMDGIPFMKEFDYLKTGDYDPTRPADFLDALFNLFGSYQREGEQIDYVHDQEGFKKLYTLPKGDNGESRIITNHQLYNLYASGWFREKKEEISKIIKSDNLTPSDALRVLAENWKWYVTPEVFKRMPRDIIYCVICAEEFPDSPEARKEFRRAVQSIHQTDK